MMSRQLHNNIKGKEGQALINPQELLVADPVRLAPSSVAVTALHNGKGVFLGTFLVEVGTDVDAERVRKQFSGQLIDGCEWSTRIPASAEFLL